jgi:uncharacterized protein involved in exopolysaccharide biosynthesis
MTHLKTNEYHQQLPLKYTYIAKEEDISLVDFWILIRRYKKRFIFVFSFVFLAGLLFSYFTYTEKYSLVSTIQIGTREKDNAILSIESPESLLSKINNSIIPSYTNAWNQQKNLIRNIETKSSIPKNSNIILITNITNDKDIGLLSDFQQGLIKIIIDDHKSMINSLKSKAESELRLAQVELGNLNNPLTLEHKQKAAQIELDDKVIELKKLKDERFFGVKKAEFQAEILQAKHEKKRLDDLEKGRSEQYKRIEESKNILKEKINDLKVQISDATKNMRAAAAVATEQSAMSQLLIANEIQQNQNQLAAFEERYHVQLENEKTDLLHEIEAIRLEKIELANKTDLLTDKYKVMLEDNQILRDRQRLKVDEAKVKLEEIIHQHEISTAMQEEKVREIKTRLDNFSETRAVSTAVQSLKPIGVSRLQLILVAFMGAGFVGCAAVLFAIFRDKVKERLEEEDVV